MNSKNYRMNNILSTYLEKFVNFLILTEIVGENVLVADLNDIFLNKRAKNIACVV